MELFEQQRKKKRALARLVAGATEQEAQALVEELKAKIRVPHIPIY